MKQILYELNKKVVDFYHKQLYNYTVALDYLKSRNIDNNTTICLKIGYASDDNSLYSYLKNEGYTDDVILATRNLDYVLLLEASEINTLDIVSADVLIATEAAIKTIEEALA